VKLLTYFENASLCLVDVLYSAGFSLATGKMRKNELVTGGFRVFEVGYWKDFQN
jgi:hypothetical protein